MLEEEVFRFGWRNEVCKRRDSSERVIEPYAQVVHSSSADKRTVSRVCLLETVSLGGYVWATGQVYPIGSYTRALIKEYPEMVLCMVQLDIKRKNSNEFLAGLYHRVVT